MTMHEHDLSLIMALADDSLDPVERAAAEAEIASCATCSEDLTLQRLAVSALRSAPPVALNDIERARLRRTVRDELGLVAGTAAAAPTGAAVTATGARRYRLFAALAGAAAVFIAFIAVAPTLLGGGDDDAGSDAPLEAALATETTVVADGGDAVAGDEQEETAADRNLTEAGAADDTDALTAAPETTAATQTTTQPEAATEDALPGAYVYWSEAEVEAPPGLAELADDLKAQKSLESVLGPQATVSPATLADLDVARCLELGLQAAPNTTEAFIVGVSDISGLAVAITAYVAGDFEAVTVLAQDLATCRVVASS
jgi:hypothetical protein